MGGCFSCKSSTKFNNIRVVHLNGYVENFEDPIMVSQLTGGKPPKHFVCTQAQLVSAGLKPLKPNTQLEPGHVYFLLPYSTFQSDVSPVDLAFVAKKLTTIAKTGGYASKSARTNLLASPHGSSPTWSSPGRSPNPFADRSIRVEPEQGVPAYGMQNSSKSPSWRPILATIRERSFNRRSESDLQEKHSEILK